MHVDAWMSLASFAFGGGLGAAVATLVSARRHRVEVGRVTASIKSQHVAKTAELRSAHTRTQAELVKAQRAWRQHVEACSARPGDVIVALECELKAARDEVHALLSVVAAYQERVTEISELEFADTSPMPR